jgi:colicin import membrane protein
MPRKLKTFTTSIGFFDLAIAAPSMKAALEAWGTKQNLFQRGFAKETDDPAIVAATMAHPGVVLRRAVGTQGKFTKNADLPKSVPTTTAKRAAKAKEKPVKKAGTVKRELDANVQKAAVIEFEKEKVRREKKRAREEAERRKAEIAEASEKQRRHKAVQAAEAILERARQHHEETVRRLEAKKSSIDEQLEAERRRWLDEEEKLGAKIRDAQRSS